jgi:hypothetical protein
MKKNEAEVKKLKKLRLSRETLHALTSSDTRRVVGGVESDECLATSPEFCITTRWTC